MKILWGWLLGSSRTILAPPVAARLLIFTVTIVAGWSVFKATVELKRLGWDWDKLQWNEAHCGLTYGLNQLLSKGEMTGL